MQQRGKWVWGQALAKQQRLGFKFLAVCKGARLRAFRVEVGVQQEVHIKSYNLHHQSSLSLM